MADSGCRCTAERSSKVHLIFTKQISQTSTTDKSRVVWESSFPPWTEAQPSHSLDWFILTLNNFFNIIHFLQIKGVALGSHKGTTYTGLFIGCVEQFLLQSTGAQYFDFRSSTLITVLVLLPPCTEVVSLIAFAANLYPAFNYTWSNSDSILAFLGLSTPSQRIGKQQSSIISPQIPTAILTRFSPTVSSMDSTVLKGLLIPLNLLWWHVFAHGCLWDVPLFRKPWLSLSQSWQSLWLLLIREGSEHLESQTASEDEV